MLYKKFGKTDFNVSEIGFGTWPLAGSRNNTVSYGITDEEESKKALLFAYEKGINFYDTSDFYGFGYVENLIGQVFKKMRDYIIIVTKGGLLDFDNNHDLSNKHITESLEKSLNRLQTDCIDIYMLHSPSLNVLVDGRLIELMEKFKSEGKIKEFGISLIGPNDGIRAINEFNFNIMEFNYNMLDHRAEDNGLFDLCKQKNVATIIRTPFAQGLITGKFVYNDDTADKRNSVPKEKFEKINAIYNKMRTCVKNKDLTHTQVALQYCLANPAANCVIPGMKTMKEVNENLGHLLANKLSNEELIAIKKIYIENGL